MNSQWPIGPFPKAPTSYQPTYFNSLVKAIEDTLLRARAPGIIECTDINGAGFDDFVTPAQFGAVGDGTTDDQAALVLAVASGKPVLITNTHRIASNWTASSCTLIFAGGKIKPDSGIVFGMAASANVDVIGGTQYIDLSAGGSLRTNSTDNRGPGLKISQYMPANQNTASDAEFKAALKDLFNLGYYSLDLEGRTVTVDASFDMATITGLTSKATWRRICNGQINPSSSFTTNSPTSTGTLSANCSMTAGSAAVTTTSTAALAKCMEVSGTGIPRGTFIYSIDSATQFTMSNAAMTTGASRTVTWKKHAFIFDFSGFTGGLSRFTFDSLHFNCFERASVYLGSPDDDIVEFKDCRIVRPETFGICQWYGGGGMTVDGCDFLTNDSAVAIASRTRIGCILKEDCRVINNRWAYFKHSVIMTGGSTQFIGNHPFSGQSGPTAHTAGVIYQQHGRHIIVGNYIDNGWLEFTNEVFAYSAGANIGGATITGNLFTSRPSSAAEGFIVVAPYIANSTFINMTINGNIFRPITTGGGVDLTQAMIADTTNGTFNAATVEDLYVSNNTYDNVTHRQENPARAKTTVNSGTTANVDFVNKTPFGLSPLFALGILVKGANGLGAVRSTGVSTTNVALAWPTAATVDTDLIVEATCNSVSIT